jgi:hypothetical protein
MGASNAGEKTVPYPDALLCGFNQLILTCALRDVPRAQRPAVFLNLANWGILPLSEWCVKVRRAADLFTAESGCLTQSRKSRQPVV